MKKGQFEIVPIIMGLAGGLIGLWLAARMEMGIGFKIFTFIVTTVVCYFISYFISTKQ